MGGGYVYEHARGLLMGVSDEFRPCQNMAREPVGADAAAGGAAEDGNMPDIPDATAVLGVWLLVGAEESVRGRGVDGECMNLHLLFLPSSALRASV
jgi:hypothetical protein